MDQTDWPVTSYDEVPYASYPYPRTHPDHLATLAQLFGLRPPPVDSARILELGCAAGGNLLPLAEQLPAAQLHGVDLSARQIAEGRSLVACLGLDNLRLEQADIAALPGRLGTYDYIICHGVYSWVPSHVQRAILEIGRRSLSPQGVLYVSYNAYPGWHLRGTVREMMKYHADQHQAPHERVEQSRALLDFLIDATQQTQGVYARLLRDELEILCRHEDAYLYHEHLEDTNEPLYFHEFARRAEAAGLRYLCEAQFGEMLPEGFPDEVRQTLRRIAPDIIRMEQYLDFLKNRMFRRTLLCHAEVEPIRHLTPDRLDGLWIASRLEVDDAADCAPGETRFRHPCGTELTLSDRLQTATVQTLREAWPASLPLEELAQLWPEHSSGATLPEELGCLLLRLYSADLVELRRSPDRFTRQVSAAPRAGAWSRLQAATGEFATNGRHETARLGRVDRQLLALLDGTRSHEQLVDELATLVRGGQLRLEQDDQAVSEPAAIRAVLAEALPAVLDRLARLALLIG